MIAAANYAGNELCHPLSFWHEPASRAHEAVIPRQNSLRACSVCIHVGGSGENFLVYFGTYTNELSKGIYVSQLDAATGKLSTPELAADPPSPCFVNVSLDEKFLYAANTELRLGSPVDVKFVKVD